MSKPSDAQSCEFHRALAPILVPRPRNASTPEASDSILSTHIDLPRFQFYSSTPAPAAVLNLPEAEIPHITIIRPCSGLDPQLYECLSSTFLQTYPSSKTTIYLCVSSPSDASYPTLRRLLQDFPLHDAKIFVESEDPNLRENGGKNLGPNPKIRNMSRAYHESKGDLVWIIDCNVWVSKGVAGRMVDKLCGFRPGNTRAMPYKLVHQLPLVVDGVGASAGEEARGDLTLPHSSQHSRFSDAKVGTPLWPQPRHDKKQSLLRMAGGRLEEQFISLAHDKFYTAINTVAVAPCIVGKSNMFRKSHLDPLTGDSTSYAPGIDYFSHNICEDHLIGDLLWRKKVPEEVESRVVDGRVVAPRKFGNHALVLGDVCIQPMARTSLYQYLDRRVRWLRVRKWTVTLATFVEPGVESLLCSLYAAFALTHLPWFYTTLGLPNSWVAMGCYWIAGVMAWMMVDYWTFNLLHQVKSVELDEHTPSFARPPHRGRRRPFGEWAAAWLGRELLALPIWIYACYGGGKVQWRGKWYWVGMDMMVHEINPKQKEGKERKGLMSRNPSEERIVYGNGNGILSPSNDGRKGIHGLTNGNGDGKMSKKS